MLDLPHNFICLVVVLVPIPYAESLAICGRDELRRSLGDRDDHLAIPVADAASHVGLSDFESCRGCGFVAHRKLLARSGGDRSGSLVAL